ncbi:hypothetical protein Poli38472_002359 [Pythium oligandrum]|uniref:Uncharacterized protein n=1 Tax=Pythium oligandrum TaxID=41045 RepID=A0A8K1FM85_PYTOL|nr:hypothetical protein Poli38472_002359 [Pythium oligandrum]|eukprot:TMW63418.1 hypothetical protein Poli38472_002359 [Pythium oligandrum]
MPSCSELYGACVTGVGELNVRLKEPMSKIFQPVSIVSATTSQARPTNSTLMAILVQLAPITKCEVVKHSLKGSPVHEKCSFDMAKVEIYSLLMTLNGPKQWALDGFKHHSLSEEEREQIVSQYESGNYYGTNLAMGIFATPDLPLESVTDMGDSSFPRSRIGIFAVIACVTVSVGLLFHQRRRLQNGYAPILFMQKAGPTQGKKLSGSKHKTAAAAGEELSLKQESNERFAV